MVDYNTLGTEYGLFGFDLRPSGSNDRIDVSPCSLTAHIFPWYSLLQRIFEKLLLSSLFKTGNSKIYSPVLKFVITDLLPRSVLTTKLGSLKHQEIEVIPR